MDPSQAIRDLIGRARTRWRLLRLFRGTQRGVGVASGLLAIVLLVARWADRSPLALVVLAVAAVLLVAGAIAWGLASSRYSPTDRRVARFIEERAPSLDDRLVSAVELIGDPGRSKSSALAGPMLADAAAHARQIDLDDVLSGRTLRRAGVQALAAGLVLIIIGFFAAGPARQSVDAASLILFPSR